MKYNDLIPELMVSDIEKSKDFYVSLLGFRAAYEREEDRFVFLTRQEIQIMLEQGSPEELAGMVYPFGKGINFSFGMDDVEAVYQRFLDSQYPIMNELEKRSFRVDNTEVTQMEFCIHDPDGYVIRVTS